MPTIPEEELRRLEREYPDPFVGRIEFHFGPGRGLTTVTVVQSFAASTHTVMGPQLGRERHGTA